MIRKRVLSLLLCLSLLTGKTLGKEKPKVDEQQKSSVSLQYLKEGVCNPRTLLEFFLACGLGYSYLNKGKSKKSFGSLNINNQSLNFNGTKPKKDNNITNKNINLKFDGIESKKSFGNLYINNQNLNFNGNQPKKENKFVIEKKIDNFEFSGKSVEPPKPVSTKYERQIRRIMGLGYIFDFEINCEGWKEIESYEKIIFVDIISEEDDNLVPLFSRVYKFPQKVVKGSYKFGNEYIAIEFPLMRSKPRYRAEIYFGRDNFELMSCKKKRYSKDKHLILEEYNKDKEEDDKIEIYQIKEKFGTLSCYVSKKTDELRKMIEDAEAQSYHTCEICGKHINKQIVEHYWIYPMCMECYDGMNERQEQAMEEIAEKIKEKRNMKRENSKD